MKLLSSFGRLLINCMNFKIIELNLTYYSEMIYLCDNSKFMIC